MNTNNLEKELNSILNEFKENVDAEYNQYSDEPATKADISKLAQLTYATLLLLNNSIITQLKEK